MTSVSCSVKVDILIPLKGNGSSLKLGPTCPGIYLSEVVPFPSRKHVVSFSFPVRIETCVPCIYLSNGCGGLPDGRGQGVRQCTNVYGHRRLGMRRGVACHFLAADARFFRSGPGHVGPRSRLDPLPPGCFYISLAIFIYP